MGRGGVGVWGVGWCAEQGARLREQFVTWDLSVYVCRGCGNAHTRACGGGATV